MIIACDESELSNAGQMSRSSGTKTARNVSAGLSAVNFVETHRQSSFWGRVVSRHDNYQ
jgi:hypothetical protein